MNCYWKNVLNFVSILKRMEFLDLEHCTNWLLAFWACNPKIYKFGFVRLAYLPQIIDSSWMWVSMPLDNFQLKYPDLAFIIHTHWKLALRETIVASNKTYFHTFWTFFWKNGENPFFCHFTTLSWLLLFDFYEKNCKLLLQPEAESDAAALKMMLVCLLFFWGVEKNG